MSRLRTPLAWLVLVSAVVRLFILVDSHWLVEGDEAAVGLQALGILRGERPIFYPGQAYLGNLESYLTAAVFAVSGPSRYALKVVPFVFSLVFVILCWELGRTVLRSERAGRIAALLGAIAPVYVALWSVKARGGYIEALVLSQLAWLWLWRASEPDLHPNRERAALIGGFVAGFGLWMNPISLYITGPALLVAAGRLVTAGRNGDRAPGITVGRLGVGALLGLLPVLLYRAAYGDAPFGILTNVPPLKSWGDLIAQAWQYFWSDGIPAIAGLRLPKDKPFVPDWRMVVAPVYGLAMIAALARARQSSAHLTLTLIGLCAFPIFAAGTLSGENFATLIPDSGLLTRYLLPLTVLFTLGLADFVCRLPHIPAYAMLGAVLGVNLFTIATADGVALARNEFANQPLPADYGDLIAALRSEGLQHVYTNHWIGYLLILETGEQIVAHDYTDAEYGMDRFPNYSRRVQAAPDAALVVFNPQAEPNLIDARLNALRMAYRKRELQSFIIYFAFAPRLQPKALEDVLQFPYY